VILLLAAALTDLCGPVAADPVGNPSEAASYVEVGDAAAAEGDLRVAATAYRKALAVDAGSTHARDALDALCRADRAREDDRGPLLEAIARFRAGELDEARDRLSAIAQAGGPSAPGAHFFLGLIALQRHDAALARAELERAKTDGAYAALATSMLRLAARDGVFTARVLVAGEADSNPQLLPDTPPVGATTGARTPDLDALAAVSLVARPVGWLVLRDVVSYRAQDQLTSLDFFDEQAQLAVELERGRDYFLVAYDFNDDLLDREQYLLASQGTVGYRRELGALAAVATYALRRRDYQQAAVAPFTGWVHDGAAGITVHATPTLDIDVRALVTREITADAVYADVAVGALAGVRAQIGGRVRLNAIASGRYATYDAAEPDGELRRDWHGEASADLELDLGDLTLAMCGVSAIDNVSTIDDFRYTKLVGRCGLSVAIGVP
jgi:hypothetical protein